ncbi:MAG: ribonuclease III [Nitrospirota bacterium]|nr:ribonuclease III [Nitrospirota bacterium]
MVAEPGTGEGVAEPDLDALQKKLGYCFATPALLRTSLVHRSAPNERGADCPESNERLEFLGDAVLDLVIACELFERFPQAPEGELTRYKATLVSETALAQVALRIGLGQHLILGRGEDETLGREKPSILSDALEAVFGALYRDGGMDAADRTIRKLFAVELKTVSDRSAPRGDYKTALQEWTQAQGMGLPSYRLVNTEGPDHAREYTVAVLLKKQELAQGTARSKREAERSAAQQALEQLTGQPDG